MTAGTSLRPPAPDGASVADVVERLMAEFEGRFGLADITRVVLRCRADLDCSPQAALPELVERLAHQRLLAAVLPPG